MAKITLTPPFTGAELAAAFNNNSDELYVGIGVKTPTVVDTDTYTVLSADNVIHVTRTAVGTCTITVPSALITAGVDVLVKDAGGNAGVNNITIITEGVETIDNSENLIINKNYNAAHVYSDGTNLFIY